MIYIELSSLLITIVSCFIIGFVVGVKFAYKD